MWMVIKKEGQLLIRESTTRGMSTFDTPYAAWAERIRESQRYAGITLMRVRDELNTAGRIIMPWDIDSLKQTDARSND